MNWLVIILAIILVVLVWYIYNVMNSTPSVASNVDLSKTELSINGSEISGGTSPTYAIGSWIYVKNLPTSATDIFSYVVDKSSNSPTKLFTLRIQGGSPTLIADVAITGNPSSLKSVTITQNLPVQTWVYIVVSVSSTYIDTYMNGKLVVSTPISGPYTPPNFPADNNSGPTFKSTICPVIITGLSRWNTPLDPQTVWNYYSQGNGNAMQQMLGSSYHLDVVFKKDSNVHNLSIF